MVEIITETDSISGKIQNIIRNAKKELKIVSPYIQLQDWPRVMRDLSFAIEKKDKKLNVTIITRKTKNDEENKAVLELKKYADDCSIYLSENLHSKVYYNENQALITSMNLFHHSAENNFEIGVYFSVFEQVKNIDEYIDYLISSSEKYQSQESIKKEESVLEQAKTEDFVKETFTVLSIGKKWIKVLTETGYENKILINYAPTLDTDCEYTAEVKKKWNRTPYGINVEYTDIRNIQKITGYCIICKKELDLNPDYPMCKPCYFKNKQYRGNIFGKYCHKCGKQSDEILDSKPLCKNCFFHYQ